MSTRHSFNKLLPTTTLLQEAERPVPPLRRKGPYLRELAVPEQEHTASQRGPLPYRGGQDIIHLRLY